MRQVMAIILRELLILKRKFWRYAFSFSVSPLLYLITFGWAARGRMSVNGTDYMVFMLPGLIAMSSMMNSFAMSVEINISRFYWKTFDEIRSAPVPDWGLCAGRSFERDAARRCCRGDRGCPRSAFPCSRSVCRPR